MFASKDRAARGLGKNALLTSLALGCAAVFIAWIVATNRENLRLLEIKMLSIVGKQAEIRSFELRDLPPRSTYRESVFAWISRYRPLILAESARRRVDPRAIAGVIAYEAIENPLPAQLAGVVRFSGPGKVHYKQFHTFEGNPVARQVERLGYLPRLTILERQAALRKPEGAIRYIAAIMDAFADVATKNDQAIRCRPDLLVTFFNGWDIDEATQFLSSHRGRRLRPSVVGLWVNSNAAPLTGALQLPGAWSCAFAGLRRGA